MSLKLESKKGSGYATLVTSENQNETYLQDNASDNE